MAKPNMKPENWAAIRLSYEYDPDQPSMVVAAKRAAEKFGFKSPASSTIAYRMKKDSANGNSWERYGDMKGINAAAHRKADSLMLSKESSGESSDFEGKKLTTISAEKHQATRDDSIDLRAEVNDRHRTEWKIPILLRNEALQNRKVDPKKSLELMRLAKLTAETIMIQQNGERKAWGLDEIYIDVSKMTDEQLQDILNGKMPR